MYYIETFYCHLARMEMDGEVSIWFSLPSKVHLMFSL